jgi:RNA polymerase sigma factor (sigma-70 family)
MAASLLLLARQFSPPTVADGELLDRFSRTRDNDAFAELVRRHGPVVYRICRRLVGVGAADDAFQATFLLLATRISAAKAANSVGGWLVGVAGRVARQIRRAAQRRQNHETKAANQQPVEPADSTPELLDQFRILDEELTRLPDRLRDPLVSCLLQGHTQEEAAAESGQTARTVRRRLDEAKRLLRIRLQRRGVTPAVAMGLVAGFASVTTAIPVGLDARTVAVVFDFLNGSPVLSSPPVLLAKGVASTMFARKVMVAMVAMALGITGLGFVLAEDPKHDPISPYPSVNSASAQPGTTQTSPQSIWPAQPPPASALKAPEKKSTEELERQIKQLEQSLKPDEVRFLVEAMCVMVPGKFCLEIGLADQPTKEMVVNLSRRETKMLEALIRVTPDRDIICRSCLAFLEGQSGYFEMGQPNGSLKIPLRNNNEKDETKFIALTSTVTPKIDKDTGKILLKVELNSYLERLKTIHVNTLTKREVPVQERESIQTTVKLSTGETVVMKGRSVEEKTNKSELLWILTPHLVRGKQAIWAHE